MKFLFIRLILLLFASGLAFHISSQSFYGFSGVPSALWNIDLEGELCQCGNCECEIAYIGNIDSGSSMPAISENGDLYGQHGFGTQGKIVTFDPLSGNTSTYFLYPPGTPELGGLATRDGIIFYTTSFFGSGSDLFEVDVSNGTVINLGSLEYTCEGDMTYYNGDLFYVHRNQGLNYYAIVKADTLIPANSEIVITYPYLPTLGLTASNICNTLIGLVGFYPLRSFAYINLIDGALTPICETPFIHTATSILEHTSPIICGTEIDLDCNDSSGAIGSDFNAMDYDCLSDPVAISDHDIWLLYNALITGMTIRMAGAVPDGINEILTLESSVPEINVAGSGTPTITLTNAGAAKSTDFKEALRLIRYSNTSLIPTGGLRTVEVQFTTQSGSMSNIATAFIQVNELPLVPLYLGPDITACEGESVILDAGSAATTYQWSSSQMTQTITATTSGQYGVTVTNGSQCPNADTVNIDFLPVVHFSLEGDTEICDNESATLTVVTDSPFPYSVDISADPGSPFIFSGMTGGFSFTDLPSNATLYTITSLIPGQPACIEMTDSTQYIDVYPTYDHQIDVSLCDGDSILLGNYWETEAGTYPLHLFTQEGCDSLVQVTIGILPALTIQIDSLTCDSAQAGVFFEYLVNPNGCDTVIQTTISLLPSDTTHLMMTTCRSSDTGTVETLLTNQQGCDSLIITTVIWDPPTDTTYLFQISCDSAAIGMFENILPDQSGCDSLIITMVSAGDSDTTYFFTTSCDSASLGVFEHVFISPVSGCDSVVFTTVTYSANDSTFISASSCDPADVGVFLEDLVNRFGCDSIVTTTITLALTDETFLLSETCDPTQAGVFVYNLTNQYGCDSTVTETVTLLPSDETFLFSTTCMSAEAGMFITTHFNQYGCDSTVTLTVALVPADTTIISYQTCDPSETGILETTYTSQDGCDSLVIEVTELYPLPQLAVEVTSDYHGHDISCFGEEDGSAAASVFGVPPYTYLWSTGSPDTEITGLAAGAYQVSVTDGNGCMTEGEVMLMDPDPFAIMFQVSPPGCFDQQSGVIEVLFSGGVAPVRYSLDGVTYQSSSVFSGLGGGTYTITALDANDCEVKEILWINVPLMVEVSLGDDQMIMHGDTAVLHAIVNIPFDSLSSIVWTGLNNPACPTCLTQPIAPIVTTTYSVTVTSADGCSDEDAMTIFLKSHTGIYVPNIFSPNGDQVNDHLLISAGADVEEIESMIIFDRWGNVMYSAENFIPNDPIHAWDGTRKGVTLNAGVYAYRMVVRFRDGKQEVVYGDVTLLH